MFCHIVMMQLTAAADARFHREVHRYCDRVRAECDGIVRYEYVRNVAARAKEFSHVVYSVFTSSQAHDSYQVSPVHQSMKAFMIPYMSDILVFDGELPAGQARPPAEGLAA